MDGAIEGKLLPDLEAVLNALGERVTSELIWLWRDTRTMPLDGYRGNRWKLFLDEALKEKLIAKAKENAKREKSSQQKWWEENTAEGQADAQRRADEQVASAEAFARKIAKEQWGEAVQNDEQRKADLEEMRKLGFNVPPEE
jgi:hypothetical protein